MYLGKIIGFCIGYVLHEGLGAAIGLIAGHVFDRGIQRNWVSYSQATRIRHTFFKVTFLVMGHIAKADGRVSQKEIEVAESVICRFNLNAPQQRSLAIRLFAQGKSKEFRLQAALRELLQVCHRQRDLLRLFIQLQLETALAGPILTNKKQAILLSICRTLNFSPQEFSDLQARQRAEEAFQHRHYHAYEHYEEAHSNTHSRTKATTEDSTEQAYGVLSITSQASKSEVKKAYRKLMSQYHPDKLVSKGLPEEMLTFAKEKTQEIQAAYELICQQRGF